MTIRKQRALGRAQRRSHPANARERYALEGRSDDVGVVSAFRFRCSRRFRICPLAADDDPSVQGLGVALSTIGDIATGSRLSSVATRSCRSSSLRMRYWSELSRAGNMAVIR